MCTFKESWRVERADFVAAARARSAFRSALGRISGPDADLDGAEIIFGELLTNALRYSGGAASADVRCRDKRFVLEVRDGGECFDLEAVASGPRRGDAEGGRGLMIVRRLSTNLQVTASNGGCTVAAELPVLCSDKRT
jgi:anti-sigma regulatory factor (Ser/Thr protein kinase)